MDEWVYCSKEYRIETAGGDIVELRSEDASKSMGAWAWSFGEGIKKNVV